MGKHSAPRNTYVPARMAMLSTVTLIGMAVSANAGAGAPVPHQGGTVGDGAATAPKPLAALPHSVTPVAARHSRTQQPEIGAPARQPHRPESRRAEPDAPVAGGTTALIESAQQLLDLGGTALQEPMRVVLEALRTALNASGATIGPEVAKGIDQLLARAVPRPAAPTPAPRHAAVVPDDEADPGEAADDTEEWAYETEESVDDVEELAYEADDSADETEDSAYETEDSPDADDDSAARTEDSAYAADDSAYVTDDDAEWLPLALGPSVG